MKLEFDPSEELVLLIGLLDSEGILDPLKAAQRQFKAKRLESKPENWATIVNYFEHYKVSCVLMKLSARSYDFLASPSYAKVRQELLHHIAQVPHAVFVYEDLLTLNPEKRELSDADVQSLGDWLDDEYSEMPDFYRPNDTVLSSVNEILRTHELCVLPYRRNAEITVMASAIIEDAEEGLLFRVYIPTGRMWANESKKLLELFRDYLVRVGHSSVRLDQHQTASGTMYQFYRAEKSASTETHKNLSLSDEFQEFSKLLDLSVSDTSMAESFLANKGVPLQMVSTLVTRYAKEAKRIQVDIRHEREQKVLSLRHRMESELIDVLPSDIPNSTLHSLIDAAVPVDAGFRSTLLPTANLVRDVAQQAQSVTVNIRPQFVQALTAAVAHEISGDVHLGKEDRELLALIQSHGGPKQTQLTSAVRELADESVSKSRRLLAMNQLKDFLYAVTSKAADIGTGLLQTYLESKLGL